MAKVNYQYVVDYFRKKNYPEHVAKAIAGNLGWESEFDTRGRNPKSGMLGLAQWDRKRRGDLNRFAMNKGKPWTDADTQLEFVDHELRTRENPTMSKMMMTKSVEEASDAFARGYERFTPKGKQEDPNEIAGRRYYALKGSRPSAGNKTTATTTQPTTTSSTTPRTDVSFNTEELSRRANEGVVPPASSFPRKTLEPLPESTKAASTTTTTEASVKPATTTTTTAQTPTMAKSTDTKKYNAKAMKPLENVDMLPYLSNIYSAFTRPPAAPNPILNTPVSLQRMSMDVDRTQVEGDYRDTLRNSDLVDVATSTRAKLAAKAAKFNQLSKVNETERNVNKEIANQEMTMNNAINQANRQALYNKQLQDVERQNAIINQQTANVSNVTDKMIAQQARRDQENLELQKMDILANYDQFGNLRKYMASKGLGEDATGFKTNAMGGRLYTAGRFMKTLKPIKTVK